MVVLTSSYADENNEIRMFNRIIPVATFHLWFIGVVRQSQPQHCSYLQVIEGKFCRAESRMRDV